MESNHRDGPASHINIHCTKPIQNRKLQVMNVHLQLQLKIHVQLYMYMYMYMFIKGLHVLYVHVHVHVHVYKNVYSRLHVHVCTNSILITTNEVYFYQLHSYLLEQNTSIC